MLDQLHRAIARTIPSFESDTPVPYTLIWSLLLVVGAFSVVYWSIAGFP